MAGNVAQAQNEYNKNIAPKKLKEKHELAIKQIKELQELERFMFANLQSISAGAPDRSSQQEQIRKRIQELVTIRQDLFNKLKGMYTSSQIEVTQRRYDLADQIAVGKTMEDELENTEEQLAALRSEKMNKERMVKIGEYEYSRYSEFRGMLKTIVYGCLVALLVSFLMRQPWFPSTLGVAALGVTAAVVLINIAGRLFANYKRDPMNWARFIQTTGQKYKDEVPTGAKAPQGGSLAKLLGLGCPNPDKEESFEIMGVRPHDTKRESFSYLQ